jgi:hypothetical protein
MHERNKERKKERKTNTSNNNQFQQVAATNLLLQSHSHPTEPDMTFPASSVKVSHKGLRS